jgi:hypothetical protein
VRPPGAEARIVRSLGQRHRRVGLFAVKPEALLALER